MEFVRITQINANYSNYVIRLSYCQRSCWPWHGKHVLLPVATCGPIDAGTPRQP